jgi:hypothetical protein
MPRTTSRSLLAVVLALVALCGSLAVYWLVELLQKPYLGALIMLAAWLMLGYGLWRLHPVARGIVVFLLWIAIAVLIVGVINPFTAGDLMLARGGAPSAWELALWIAPLIAASLVVLHILGKHKAEFQRKHDALQAPEGKAKN